MRILALRLDLSRWHPSYLCYPNLLIGGVHVCHKPIEEDSNLNPSVNDRSMNELGDKTREILQMVTVKTNQLVMSLGNSHTYNGVFDM